VFCPERSLDMKWLAVAVGVVATVFVVKRVAMRRSFDFEKVIERMPEGSPPKWMFGNINTIRANTERIIELLEPKPEASPGSNPS
jgi:hypothetical protein